FGDDLDVLADLAGRIASVARGLPGAEDVRVEQVTGLPALSVTPDREALARHGLNPGVVRQAVATAVGGRVASELCGGERRVDIVVRLPEAWRGDAAALADLPVPLDTQVNMDESRRRADWRIGPPHTVPLREVARIDTVLGPSQV